MKKSLLIVSALLVFSVLTLSFTGCKVPFSQEDINSAATGSGTGGSTTTFTVPTSVSVEDATAQQCPTGGIYLTTFQDANFNGVLDADEKVVTTKAICNGAAGTSAGILAEQAPLSACPAGGILVKTLSGQTVTSINTICNGVNGSSGANGNNAHLNVTAASSAQCAAGGAVYATWTDGSTPIYTVVCNGENGASGTNGTNAVFQMGSVGPIVKDKAYSVCHHDYLYIPGNEKTGASGWLIFRHQKNGSADQGIGATGFNVWNVDISDFALVSEDKNVTYCNMRWNPFEKKLTYTVVDRTDGQVGLTETIRLE